MADIRCPPTVARELRVAGWSGHSGWWQHPMQTGARRWWEAYCVLRSVPRVRRCRQTIDFIERPT